MPETGTRHDPAPAFRFTVRFDDLPPGYPDNVDHDPPLDRKPGAEPALSEADIDDLIAFLETLNDGYVVP